MRKFLCVGGIAALIFLFLVNWIILLYLLLSFRYFSFGAKVSVGMTEADVLKAAGEPTRIFSKDTPLPYNPKAYNISSRENENKVYVYNGKLFGAMIFVYFDEANHVSCVYFGGT